MPLVSRLATLSPGAGRKVAKRWSKERFSPTTTTRCSIGVAVRAGDAAAPTSDRAAQDAGRSAARAVAATHGFVALAMRRIIGGCGRLSHHAPQLFGAGRASVPARGRLSGGCWRNRCRLPAIALTRDATLARDASKLLGSAANFISAAAARQQGTSA